MDADRKHALETALRTRDRLLKAGYQPGIDVKTFGRKLRELHHSHAFDATTTASHLEFRWMKECQSNVVGLNPHDFNGVMCSCESGLHLGEIEIDVLCVLRGLDCPGLHLQLNKRITAWKNFYQRRVHVAAVTERHRQDLVIGYALTTTNLANIVVAR